MEYDRSGLDRVLNSSHSGTASETSDACGRNDGTTAYCKLDSIVTQSVVCFGGAVYGTDGLLRPENAGALQARFAAPFSTVIVVRVVVSYTTRVLSTVF